MSEIPSVDEIAGRFARLQEQVHGVEAAAGRTEGSVQIELAAKYQAPERVLAALQADGTLLGHNIIQQLEASETALAAASAPAHRTHVIGHVQKNKAAKALRYSQCIETVDSFKLAARLGRLWGEQHPFDIMIQVNSSGAQSQYGRDPERVLDLAGRIAELPNLRIIGLMTIGAHTDETSEIARSFQIVRELRDELQRAGIASATELSMGMTHDMDIAIAEGSTIIRVGTAVFGPRPQV
ncbi:MAG: YggS family pyridoxal phosphate-dependent enzyme [Ancrocorticia sp.]